VPEKSQPEPVDIVIVLERSVVEIHPDKGIRPLQNDQTLPRYSSLLHLLRLTNRTLILDLPEHRTKQADQQLRQGTSYQLFIIACPQQSAQLRYNDDASLSDRPRHGQGTDQFDYEVD
jgi:hypothetical protein